MPLKPSSFLPLLSLPVSPPLRVRAYVCLEGRESVPLSLSLSLSLSRAARSPTRFARERSAKKEKKRGVSELRRLDLEHQFFFFRRRQRTLVSLADASSPARAFFLAPPGAAMGPTSRLAAAVSAAGATAWTAAVSRCLNAFFLDALMIEHFFSQPRPPPPSSSLLLSPFTPPPTTHKKTSLSKVRLRLGQRRPRVPLRRDGRLRFVHP